MAATFTSVVLGQPEIALIVFEFQFGLYDDVRPAFFACNELMEYDASDSSYECDASFWTTFAPAAECPLRLVGPISYLAYALNTRYRDDRLPLHMAICQGLLPLTKRILCCRPDLASEDAIILAFLRSHLDIVEFLLDERANIPELSRCVSHKSGRTGGRVIRRFPGPFLDTLLARDDTKGVTLLQRFGPNPDDILGPQNLYVNIAPEKVCQNAIQAATPENATLALVVFPWLQYPSLLDDIAAKGFLPLVQSLHERGLNCSTDAMDKAATNGHFNVVRFLHEHRREGCTTNALDNAAANGHLEVVQFLHFNRTEGCSIVALNKASGRGHLDIVRFLIEHRTEGASSDILDEAAGNGHLGVVEYLQSLGTFTASNDAIEKACAGGHLEVVKFLLANGSEERTSYYAVRNAIRYGHLTTAKYLLSRGYEYVTTKMHWDSTAFRKPEIIDVLQLFKNLGGRRDAMWMEEACATNNEPLARFVHELAGDNAHCFALRDAIAHEAWDVVHYLMANSTAEIPVEALKQLLGSSQFDIATQILCRQPRFRLDDSVLEWSSTNHYTEATRYLLAAGIGKPRECLLKIAGRRQHVTASKLLVPYCMHTAKYFDNVSFLLDMLALRNRRRKTTLQLITQELKEQGRNASQKIPLAPSVAARALRLLDAGVVVDWALALVIGHLHATDATTTTEQLEKKTTLVQDAELKAQLHRLLASKRKRSTLEN